MAATYDWDFAAAGSYSYDSNKIEVASGVAKLKPQYTPGTDWIADQSGNSWGLRKKITFNNASQAENLVNFPVLVKLDSSRIDYAKTKDAGEDIRFTDSDKTTALAYEIEKWDESGSSFVWVKVPQIDASSSTDHIYLYYANPNASDGQQPTNVWDSNYVTVQHLAETSGTNLNDSSASNVDGTKISASEPNPTTSGQIGNAQSFDGSDDYYTLPATYGQNLTTQATLELWIKLTVDNPTEFRTGIANLGSVTSDVSHYPWTTGGILTNVFRAVRLSSVDDGAFNKAIWHKLTISNSPGAGNYRIYQNNSLLSSTTGEATITKSTDPGIGKSKGTFSSNYYLDGTIDEVRISSIARSAAWVAASYLSESDTFNSLGSAEQFYYQGASIEPQSGLNFTSIQGLTVTAGAGNLGSFLVQLSADGGSSWWWHNGTAWAVTTAGSSEANTPTQITNNLATFTVGASPKSFKWKIFLSEDGSQLVVLDTVSTTYTSDVTKAASWQFGSAGDYTLSDGTLVEVTDNRAREKVRNYLADADTKALYHFDESGGNPADSSGNGNNLTASNASFTGGNLNNAISLNGSTSTLRASNSASLTSGQPLTLEAWTKFNSAFSANSHSNKQTIIDKGEYQLYRDNQTGKLTFELANNSSNTWTQVAGNNGMGSNIKNSWENIYNQVVATAISGTTIYIGLGSSTGNGEVWSWNGSVWTKIGGDGLNASWLDATHETVSSLQVIGSTLYAGLGNTWSASDGEVWSWNGSVWTKIGGDGLNAGFNGTGEVGALTAFGGNLVAGCGANGNGDSVWSWNGSTWTKLGGDGVNSSWADNIYERVYAMAADAGNMYVGLGSSTGDGDVWKWNGTVWSQIGGDGLNSGWASSTIETVESLLAVGTDLYAGTGNSAGDGDVWKWNGTVWSQIGGDGLNSGWAAGTYESVLSLATDGTYFFAGLGSSINDGEIWRWDGSAWTQYGGDNVNSSFNGHYVYRLAVSGTTLYAGVTFWNNVTPTVYQTPTNTASWSRIGAQYINKSWGYNGLEQIEAMAVVGQKLYAGSGISAGDGLVFEYDGNSWVAIGGQGINSGWGIDSVEAVTSLVDYGGTLYAGTGTSAGDADVWKWNGTTWSQVGGDGLNSSWSTNYETVRSMAVYGGNLVVGLGNSQYDHEVYSYNGTIWSKIGGDGVNSSWNGDGYEIVAMAVHGGDLYVGIGRISNAEVWRWNGSIWTKVGGGGLNSSWSGTDYSNVFSLATYDGDLYAGLGSGIGHAEVWRWNGSIWTKVGGDGLSSGWASGTESYVRVLIQYNGDLYAGLGATGSYIAPDVWKYDGSSWSQIGGGGLNGGWTSIPRTVHSMAVYQGRLYVSPGDSGNAGCCVGYDARIWSWGNNSIVTSSSTSQDTGWHHLVGTYDGSTMKLYIDGTLVGSTTVVGPVPSSSHALRIGSSFGSTGTYRGEGNGTFNGLLDEVRISGVARSLFITSPYAATKETLRPSAAAATSGVYRYQNFYTQEAPNGGTFTYRLSHDNGSTWKYYSGGAWVVSGSLEQSSSAATINSNIVTFPVTTSGIIWQAVLTGDGTQRLTLHNVTIAYEPDETAPTNPSTVSALDSAGGSIPLSSGVWYNYQSPNFSWSGATDIGGSGVEGYWVYLGTSSTADPTTAGVFQSASSYTASGLTSGQTYYLRVRTRDNAQNVYSNVDTSVYTLFTYKYDGTAPENPKFISVGPSGYSAINSFTFLWPGSGPNGPSDSFSGLAGYQYKTGASSGPLSTYSSTTTQTSIAIDDAAYIEGVNTFYLRVIDVAGNASEPITASYYYSVSAPSAPTNLSVTPTSNNTNSFAFSWATPTSYQGETEGLTYLYSINTVPTPATVSSNGNSLSLSAGPYATQQGINTFYVVAQDAASNVNYANYASVTFSATTTAPGQPLNMVISDSSNRATNQFRLSLTWEAPSSGVAVSSYKVYRSTDGNNFGVIGTISSAGFIDSGLSNEVTYSYKVKAYDNAGAGSIDSTTVSKRPTGKYTVPPSITSQPKAVAGATSAVISWDTDRVSDSFVEYGITNSYGSSMGAREEVTDHAIQLTGLTPGTVYHYRVQSLDDGSIRDYDSSQGKSSDFIFTTAAAPSLSNVKFSDITTSSVIISFETNKASSAVIDYGTSTNYGSQIVSESASATKHTLRLGELDDGTTYQVKISISDSDGNKVTSPGHAFTTVAKPRIDSVRFENLNNQAQITVKVTWKTNVPTTGSVYYQSQGEGRKEVATSEYKTEHEFAVSGLLDQSVYTFQAISRDRFGNEVTSETNSIQTPLDSRPPKLSNLTVEIRSSGIGVTQKAQLVVSWETDEPATSQIEYGPGISSDSYSARSQEDIVYTTNHVVIVSELEPAKLYHLRAVSRDKAGNLGASPDTTAITGKIQRSVIDVIINSLSRSLGFMSKLGNLRSIF